MTLQNAIGQEQRLFQEPFPWPIEATLSSSLDGQGGGTGVGYQPQGSHPNNSSNNTISTNSPSPPPGA